MTFSELKEKHKDLIERSKLPMVSSVCAFCVHYQGKMSCQAFNKIPKEIWLGENDHRKPFPGDNGIQFEIRRAAQGF